MSKKIKLAPYVLKRYEQRLNTYFFYNLATDKFWETDYVTGSIIAILDGTLTRESVCSIIAENNPQTPQKQIQKHLNNVFSFMLREGFIYEY